MRASHLRPYEREVYHETDNRFAMLSFLYAIDEARVSLRHAMSMEKWVSPPHWPISVNPHDR
jgi:hypothetical protein